MSGLAVYTTNTGTSPNKQSVRLTNPHSTAQATLQQARGELRDTMRGKINVVDYNTFTKHFLPSCKKAGKTNVFEDPPEMKTEKAMYEWITTTLNESNICTSEWLFVATPYKTDPNDPTKQAVDCGLYQEKYAPLPRDNAINADDVQNRRVNWSRVDLSIECKVDKVEQDPFDDTQDNGEPLSVQRKEALGQILSYAELIFKHQHRQFHYMVLFLGNFARIVRLDRSGLFTTTKFDYTTEGAKLTTFLQRYVNFCGATRGYDPTATRLEPSDPLAEKMRQLRDDAAKIDPDNHVQQLYSKSLGEEWAWWQLEVHIAPKPDARKGKGKQKGKKRSAPTKPEVRKFLVGRPHFQAPGVVGRSTRGYVAVGIDSEGELVDYEGKLLYQNGKLLCVQSAQAIREKKRGVAACFVYLKDAWRVDHDGIEQEGTVLELLCEKHVKYVPHLVCHGDLQGQVTKAQEVWYKLHKDVDPSDCRLKKHQHYRLVVREVGKPLDQFEYGLQLVFALWCAMFAHKQAYKEAGIIHRDISSGNILLYQNPNGNWTGLLNDWELSKKVDYTQDIARQPDRTGTWQFMSAHALNDPCKEIVIEDELESLFHVLIYYAVRFLPHNIEPTMVGQFMVDYFDGCFKDVNGYYLCGKDKQNAMENGKISITSYFNGKSATLEFYSSADSRNPHPINALIKEVLAWLAAHYSLSKETPTQQAGAAQPPPDEFHMDYFDAEIKHDVKTDDEYNLNVSSRMASTSKPLNQDYLALNLKTHRAMLDLFEKSLQQPERAMWPTNDKGEDMKPKRIIRQPSPDKLPAGTSKITSKKRPLEDPAPPPSSKRSR